MLVSVESLVCVSSLGYETRPRRLATKDVELSFSSVFSGVPSGAFHTLVSSFLSCAPGGGLSVSLLKGLLSVPLSGW